ncbi:MAG: hypothetical protein NPINA01_30900 [Nitrospinaceae bacterium]|nr:MAG: hypothetical protein NPINA01_30900 [Nitrospinaceae bacterium]
MSEKMNPNQNPEAMPHSNQIGKLKEQLRVKSLEVKKKDAEKTRQEHKVLQVIEISKKKISDLKLEIEKVNSSLRASSQNNPASGETAESPKESDKQLLKNVKITEAIKKLKRENLALTERIKAEKAKREQILREKARLLEEVERLAGSSEKVSELNEQILKLNQDFEDSHKKHKKLIEEKDKLLAKYQQILEEKRAEEAEGENARKINLELKTQLQRLTAIKDSLELERKSLESQLKEKKRLFERKLAEKVKNVEEEWEKKIKILGQKKQRVNHFAEDIMEEAEAPLWMITYSDMATLLLTFFILYYSIAAQNLGKFMDAVMEESKENLGMIELLDVSKIRTTLRNLKAFESNNIVNDIENFAKDENDLGITEENSKIVVRIPGQTLFQPSSAVLEKIGWPVLEETAKIFKKYPHYKVHIQGHTDDTPISTDKFPTNWELSSTRATAVLRFLIDKGLDPGRLTATGYADTFPLSPNTSAQGRAKNRRVEFVLEKID